MHCLFKKAILVCAVSLLIQPAVDAATPTFDNWAVTTNQTIKGQITGCPAGFSCTNLMSGNGFLQQSVTDGVDRFIQTIITEPGANGVATAQLYADESFVKPGNTGFGILSKRVGIDAEFTGTSLLSSGWAASAANLSVVQITQAITDAGTAVLGDEHSSTFTLDVTNDSLTNAVTSKALELESNVGMGDGVVNDSVALQKFLIKQFSGDALTTSGSLDFGPAATVSWQAGGAISLVWLGQRFTAFIPRKGPPVYSTLGFEGATSLTEQFGVYSNVTADIVADPNTSTGYNIPYDWDIATFGSVLPSMPAIP